MSRRDPTLAIRHMLGHAREACSLIQGKDRGDLDRDRTLALAVTHLLEIVGEAAGRVPENERGRYPHVPWSEIVGLRNRLIHGYDAVDLDILWQILKQDLPPLIKALEAIDRDSPR